MRIAGASPETLVRLEDGRAEVRPIAGTRPRGATPEDDARIERELFADPKEIAEHVMLVDLGRNDLGRISEPGSVRVTERMITERYSHVMHITSNVRGQARAAAATRSTCCARRSPPARSAARRRCARCRSSRSSSPSARGIYGGAIGYIGFDGNMDVAIAIRTVVEQGGELLVQAGAGIVEASDPDAEYEEMREQGQAPRSRRSPRRATPSAGLLTHLMSALARLRSGVSFDMRSGLRYKPRSAGGVVVKLVITPACHAGGRGFKSRPPRQALKRLAGLCNTSAKRVCKKASAHPAGAFLLLAQDALPRPRGGDAASTARSPSRPAVARARAATPARSSLPSAAPNSLSAYEMQPALFSWARGV